MAVTFDITELREFAAHLDKAADVITREHRQVVSKGALNIKNTMRKDADQSRHFRFSRAISYDMSGNRFFSEAQIGPEKGRPGSIANIAYFGGSRGGGTVRAPKAALDEELPNFTRALEELAAKAMP